MKSLPKLHFVKFDFLELYPSFLYQSNPSDKFTHSKLFLLH